MAEKEAKVTTMVLKVNLQCPKCYKKVKKVLCKFPQIQDQVYNEKANTVTIKVVCCSPEKIRDKLCYKGGRSIKSIEIKEPEKPKPPEKKPEKPKEGEKPKEAEKKPEKEKPKEGDKPKEAEKPKEKEKPKEQEKPKQAEAAKQPAEAPIPTAIPIFFPPPVYPAMGFHCNECYKSGIVGGPCFHGGTVVQYDGYYGRPVYDSWGGGAGAGGYRGGYVNRNDYFSEENQQGCSIM